jgi:hypothetical protein
VGEASTAEVARSSIPLTRPNVADGASPWTALLASIHPWRSVP